MNFGKKSVCVNRSNVQKFQDYRSFANPLENKVSRLLQYVLLVSFVTNGVNELTKVREQGHASTNQLATRQLFMQT